MYPALFLFFFSLLIVFFSILNVFYTVSSSALLPPPSTSSVKGREEQAEPDGMEEVTRAAKLIGTDVDYFVDTFMKPKLKVGKDYVKKGQNKDQVAFAISG